MVCDFFFLVCLQSIRQKCRICHSGNVFSTLSLMADVLHPDTEHVTVKLRLVHLANEGRGRWQETSHAFQSVSGHVLFM